MHHINKGPGFDVGVVGNYCDIGKDAKHAYVLPVPFFAHGV